MARVIKSQKEVKDMSQVVVNLPKEIKGGRVIDRDIYRANQMAKQILFEGQQEKKKRLAGVTDKTTLATEEAVAHGATEAISATAKRAIEIFYNKANRYADVESDLRVLVEEITKRLLGQETKLPKDKYDEIVNKGINKLRSHRKLRLEFATGALEKAGQEEKALITKLQKIPDFELVEVANVPADLVRVVTDVGSALCEEKAALSALAIF